MRSLFCALVLTLLLSTTAVAELAVVATLPWVGSITREIGGNRVAVTTLVKPHQDPHRVEAKPSMILAARKADLIIYNGLDLEIGYLPQIIESSRNPSLMPGRPGNLDCSRFVRVLEKPLAVDRSMGDVHPLGNPHYHFSPSAMQAVAAGIRERLIQLDGAGAPVYRANYDRFAQRLREHQRQWHAVPLQGKTYIAYHRLFEYLAAEFSFHIVGYIESKPGIPPSAAHLEGLLQGMRREPPNGILTTEHFGKKEAQAVAARSGVRVLILPSDVGSAPGADDWFTFMDNTLAILK